jgi:hypothetical protein
MLSLWNIIVGLLGGIVKISLRVLDMIKEKRLIDQGRALERGKIAEEQLEITREQTEILISKADKKDIVDKMESGKF